MSSCPHLYNLNMNVSLHGRLTIIKLKWGDYTVFNPLESKLISDDENISFRLEGNKITVDERWATWEHTALWFPLQGRRPLRAKVILNLVSTCLERNEYIFLLTPMFLPLAIWTIETRHLIKLEPEFPPKDPIQRELKDTCLQPARGTICLLERRDFTQCQRLVRPSSMQENRPGAVMYQLWTRLHLDYDYLIMRISYSLLKFYPHTKTLKMNLVGRGIVWLDCFVPLPSGVTINESSFSAYHY